MRFVSLAVATAVLLLLAAPTIAGPSTTSKQFGKTIGQWSAEWWQEMIVVPALENPMADETGENCHEGQPGGKVFFLAGNGGGQSIRDCTVSRSKALLFPLINFVAWAPEDGADEAELRLSAAGAIDLAEDFVCMLDGLPCVVQGQEIVRAQSPPFSFGPSEFFGLPEGKELAVSDGYWVMLPPLSRGRSRASTGRGRPRVRFRARRDLLPDDRLIAKAAAVLSGSS